MKHILIFFVVVILLSCQKQTISKSEQPQQKAGKGKGHGAAATTIIGQASSAHYFSIHDSIVVVDGVQRLALVGQQITPFPDGSTVFDLQINHSMTDTSTAVPAQTANFIFGYPGNMYNENGILNFDLNYFWVYDANSFPGQGVATYWFVGENYTGSGPFNPDASWYPTGSDFDQLTWNSDGTITH